MTTAVDFRTLDEDEIDARCFEEWVQRRPLGDYTVPRHSLIRGARVKAMLHRIGQIHVTLRNFRTWNSWWPENLTHVVGKMSR